MKSKKFTYLLIIVVAGLWAVIFHRIYAATKDKGDRDVHVPIKKHELFNQVNHQHDRLELEFDYRDPFSAELFISKEVGEAVIVNETLKIPIKPMVRWPELSYLGWIAGNGNAKFALLVVAGKEMMLAEGQRASGVKLLRIAADSLNIEFEHETRYIKLK